MKKNNVTIKTRYGFTTTPQGFLKLQETQRELANGHLDWMSNPYFWVALNATQVIKSHYWLFDNGKLSVFKGDFEVTIKDDNKTRTYAGKKGLALLRALCLPVVENW